MFNKKRGDIETPQSKIKPIRKIGVGKNKKETVDETIVSPKRNKEGKELVNKVAKVGKTKPSKPLSLRASKQQEDFQPNETIKESRKKKPLDEKSITPTKKNPQEVANNPTLTEPLKESKKPKTPFGFGKKDDKDLKDLNQEVTESITTEKRTRREKRNKFSKESTPQEIMEKVEIQEKGTKKEIFKKSKRDIFEDEKPKGNKKSFFSFQKSAPKFSELEAKSLVVKDILEENKYAFTDNFINKVQYPKTTYEDINIIPNDINEILTSDAKEGKSKVEEKIIPDSLDFKVEEISDLETPIIHSSLTEPTESMVENDLQMTENVKELSDLDFDVEVDEIVELNDQLDEESNIYLNEETLDDSEFNLEEASENIQEELNVKLEELSESLEESYEGTEIENSDILGDISLEDISKNDIVDETREGNPDPENLEETDETLKEDDVLGNHTEESMLEEVTEGNAIEDTVLEDTELEDTVLEDITLEDTVLEDTTLEGTTLEDTVTEKIEEIDLERDNTNIFKDTHEESDMEDSTTEIIETSLTEQQETQEEGNPLKKYESMLENSSNSEEKISEIEKQTFGQEIKEVGTIDNLDLGLTYDINDLIGDKEETTLIKKTFLEEVEDNEQAKEEEISKALTYEDKEEKLKRSKSVLESLKYLD